MKTIKLENQDLFQAVLFLKSLHLKGNATRGKQKFIERLVEKNNEYGTQEKELLKPYSKVDEDGQLVISEGRYELKEEVTKEEKEQLLKEREELNKEIAEISFVEYSSKYEALFGVLDDWQEPIAPEHSFIYDKLMDKYEENEEGK